MIPEELERVFKERTVNTSRGTTRVLDSEIPVAYARALHQFVLDRRPRRALEIGMACGVSSVAMSRVPSGTMYCPVVGA